MELKSLAIIACSLVALSCKKNSTNAPTAAALVREIQVSTPDSLIVLTYDSNSKLIGAHYNRGSIVMNNLLLTRNSDGIITGWQDDGYVLGDYTEQVYSDPITHHYISAIRTFPGGALYKDEFTYTNNNITQVLNYYDIGSGTYTYNQKTLFSYDANGNISGAQFSLFRSGAWSPLYTSVYTYDNMVNPLQMGDEGVLLMSVLPYEIAFGRTGPNNFTSGGVVTTNSYTYDSNNEPAALTITYDSSPIQITSVTFLY